MDDRVGCLRLRGEAIDLLLETRRLRDRGLAGGAQGFGHAPRGFLRYRQIGQQHANVGSRIFRGAI